MTKFQNIPQFRFLIGCCLLAFLVGCNSTGMPEVSTDGILFYELKGQGKNIVFLHGILGSHSYWEKVVPELSQTYQLVLIDLLGFGNSPKPKISYTVNEHIEKINHTITAAIGAHQKVQIVGHSMGAILALNYAIAYPDQVSRLILINPPMVTDENDLKQAMEDSSSKMMVTMTFSKIWGKLVCKIHELAPAISYPLIRLLEPELPPAVARAAGQHTWESYSGSFQHVLLDQDFYALIAKIPSVPTLIIASEHDEFTKTSALNKLPKRDNLKSVLLPGTHNVLLTDPLKISKEIKAFIQ